MTCVFYFRNYMYLCVVYIRELPLMFEFALQLYGIKKKHFFFTGEHSDAISIFLTREPLQ